MQNLICTKVVEVSASVEKTFHNVIATNRLSANSKCNENNIIGDIVEFCFLLGIDSHTKIQS